MIYPYCYAFLKFGELEADPTIEEVELRIAAHVSPGVNVSIASAGGGPEVAAVTASRP